MIHASDGRASQALVWPYAHASVVLRLAVALPESPHVILMQSARGVGRDPSVRLVAEVQTSMEAASG